MEDFFYLGVITKPFGYKGQLVIYLDTDEPHKYKSLDSVFIEIGDEKLPYIIEDIQMKSDNNQAIVKFQDIDGEEAKSFVKAKLFLPLSMLPPLEGNKFYYHEVIGFKVIDKEKGEIGICKDFIDIAHQSIMQIDFQGKEILIPAIDEIFETVDRINKTIHITAPEGLIDIYL